MNIAILVEGGLCETLQTAPLAQAIRRGLPDAHILLVAPSRAAELTGLRYVDGVLPLAGLDQHPSPGSWAAAWLELRRRRIDVAFLCGESAQLRLLAYSTGIPRRIGRSSGATSVLLSDHRKDDRRSNRAAAWLGLAPLLGIAPGASPPLFSCSEAAQRQADSLLLGAGIDPDRLLVAMAPGLAGADPAGAPASQLTWDPERYAHLANQLALRHGAAVVLLGDEADRPAVNATLSDLGAAHLDLCGELNLDETAAILRRCDLLVAADTPLLHLAAATGTPALGLFGPTDGRRRGPFGDHHRSIQALTRIRGRGGTPAATVRSIRVEDVLAGIEAS